VLVRRGTDNSLAKTPYVSLIQGIIRRERLFMPMRRLSLTLLCALIAVPAALAGAQAAGDGVLEVRAVNGTVVLTGKGVVWGQMDKGRLAVNDVLPGDGEPLVSGWDQKLPGVCDTCTIYTGRDLHFRVTGGKYRLAFHGSGIDFSAVGVGNVQLTGDVMAVDTGYYAVDGGKWTTVPWLKRTVYFPAQPIVPAGP
jgi:hypothetical protein